MFYQEADLGKAERRQRAVGGLPGKQPISSKSRLRCKDTHVQRRGCPSDSTAGRTLGAAARGHRWPRCRAGTGRQQRCSRSLMHYPRKSAIFAGEEFFLIGPHGDIRAIFKEV